MNSFYEDIGAAAITFAIVLVIVWAVWGILT